MVKKSNLKGFYKLSLNQRIQKIKKIASLNDEEIDVLNNLGALRKKQVDIMIENAISNFQIPLGMATNFKINGKDYLIPMAIEEPSVIAAASFGAKISRNSGGFISSANPPVMIGQIQLVSKSKSVLNKAAEIIRRNKNKIMEESNPKDSTIVTLGGGVKNIESKIIKTIRGNMLIVNIHIDVRDSMGANSVNTIVEKITPKILEMTKTNARLKILSNLSTLRIVKSKTIWKKEDIGEDVIEGILDAYAFAEADQYRCTTHNKGIMNGIDAIAIATGNDFRAIESAAHSYAAFNKKGYKSLTKYYKNKENDLVGEIEIPISVGIVGGATKTHPVAKIMVKILDVNSAQELAEIMASVGLAQNFAALRAMVVEGIQKGHMKLHSKNIAVIAGAKGNLIKKVADTIIKEGNITVVNAKKVLSKILKKK